MEKISIENLSINIKKNGQTFKIMDNQSLEIRPGDVILISGPNGSGKSSVIKTIVGDLLDFSGLSYTGKLCFYERNNDYFLIDENQKNRRLFLSRCCYVSQNDDTPFVEVLDSILASLDSFSIENKLRYVFDFIYNNSFFRGIIKYIIIPFNTSLIFCFFKRCIFTHQRNSNKKINCKQK